MFLKEKSSKDCSTSIVYVCDHGFASKKNGVMGILCLSAWSFSGAEGIKSCSRPSYRLLGLSSSHSRPALGVSTRIWCFKNKQKNTGGPPFLFPLSSFTNGNFEIVPFLEAYTNKDRRLLHHFRTSLVSSELYGATGLRPES